MFTVHCPTCRKQVSFATREDAPHRPFCSERCKLIDLGKWLDEEYRVSEPLDPARDRSTPDDDRSPIGND